MPWGLGCGGLGSRWVVAGGVWWFRVVWVLGPARALSVCLVVGVGRWGAAGLFLIVPSAPAYGVDSARFFSASHPNGPIGLLLLIVFFFFFFNILCC